MYYQNNPIENIKAFFRQKSVISRLIIINIAVFVFVNIVNLFLWLFQVDSEISNNLSISPIVYWFAVPSDINLLLSKPWTLFTYMFLQVNFFHIFFNMFVLYFGGRIFLEYLNSKKLLGTYIWGGIAGGLFYVLAYNIFPAFSNTVSISIALGASASVLAILVAISVYVPNYTVTLFLFGRMKLKYIALILVAIDILSIRGDNPGGHIAHLGGALWGFLYIYFLKKGFDFNNIIKFNKISGYFKTYKKPKKNYSKSYYSERPLTDDEYNKRKAVNQEKIDEILDKISKSGYEKLTKEEKELLFKMSNK
jgi:membrane associated rhomboid family serine protease